MHTRKKIVIEAALVVVLGGGLAVAGGAVAGALPLDVPGIPGLSALSAPVGDHSAPVGDDSAPVGDDSAPRPDDDKYEDDKGLDESKYYDSKAEHDAEEDGKGK